MKDNTTKDIEHKIEEGIEITLGVLSTLDYITNNIKRLKSEKKIRKIKKNLDIEKKRNISYKNKLNDICTHIDIIFENYDINEDFNDVEKNFSVCKFLENLESTI